MGSNKMKDDDFTSSQTDILSRYAIAVAEASSRDEICQSAEQTASKLIGHSLFTIMAFDPDMMEVERFYTSDPDNYPAGGRKKKRDTEWGRYVLLEGRTYIGASDEDIRQNFDDYEVIAGLGLCSVINIPIKRLGGTIGTMNLLDTTAHYNDTDANIGAVIAMGLATTLS